VNEETTTLTPGLFDDLPKLPTGRTIGDNLFADLPKLEPEPPASDWLGIGEEVSGVGNSLLRGGLNFAQWQNLNALRRRASIPRELAVQDALEKEATDYLSGKTPHPAVAIRGFVSGADEMDYRRMMRNRLGETARNKARLQAELDQIQTRLPTITSELASNQELLEAIPETAAQKEFHQEATPWWKFFDNPVELTLTTTAESAPVMAQSIVAAPLGPPGAAVVTGLASFQAESSARVMAAMQAAGVDLKQPEQVMAWLADRAKSDRALAKADLAALGPATFDALTMGIAGRWLRAAEGGGTRKIAGALAKESGAQMAGGGLGSIAGSGLAGEKVDWKDVMLEVAGEFAPVESISTVAAENNISLTHALQERALTKAIRESAHIQATANSLPAQKAASFASYFRAGVERKSSEPQPLRTEPVSHSRPPGAVVAPAPAGTSPGEELTQEIAANVVPPSLQRVDDATGKPLAAALTDLGRVIADIKAQLQQNQIAPPAASPLTPATPSAIRGPGAAAGTVTGQNEGKASDATAATTLAAEQMPAEVVPQGQESVATPTQNAPVTETSATLKPRPPSRLSPLTEADRLLYDISANYGHIPIFIPDNFTLANYQRLAAKVRAHSEGALTRKERAYWRRLRETFPDNFEDDYGPGGELAINAYRAARRAGIDTEVFGTPNRGGPQKLGEVLEHVRRTTGREITARDLWAEVERTAERHLKQREQSKQDENFQRIVLANRRPKAQRGQVDTFPSEALRPGDSFTAQGKTIEAKSRTVDEGTPILRLVDGPKFGTQTIYGNEMLYVDKGSLEFGPEHDGAPDGDRRAAGEPANPEPTDDAPFAAGNFQETPARFDGREADLDAIAQDLYGQAYDELPEFQQGNVQVTLDHKDTRTEAGQISLAPSPVSENERPALPAGPPAGGAIRALRPTRARAEAARQRKALAQEIFRQPVAALSESSRRYLNEELRRGRRSGDAVTDPIQQRLVQLHDEYARLAGLLAHGQKRPDGIYAGVSQEHLSRWRYVTGQLDLLQEIAHASPDLQRRWFRAFTEAETPGAGKVETGDADTPLTAGEDFAFDAPKSVAEQKARQTREGQQARQRAAQEQMAERARARLTADEDTRTQDMFGSPEHRTTRQGKGGQGSLFSAGEGSETEVPAPEGNSQRQKIVNSAERDGYGSYSGDSMPVDDYVKWTESIEDVLGTLKIPDGWEVENVEGSGRSRSTYWHLRDPDGEAWTIRISDHQRTGSALQREQPDFDSIADQSGERFGGKGTASVAAWSRAVERAEKWLTAKHQEFYGNANAAIAGGAAGIKTPLETQSQRAEAQADKSNVAGLRPEEGSALTHETPPQTGPGVNPDFAAGQQSDSLAEVIHEKHSRQRDTRGRDNRGVDLGNALHAARQGRAALARILAQARARGYRHLYAEARIATEFYATAEARQLTALAAQHGAQVVFYQAAPTAAKGALELNGTTIALNVARAERATIFEHELAHFRYRQGDASLRALAAQVDLSSPQAQLFRERYNRWLGRPLTDALAAEEITAYYVSGDATFGDMSKAFSDPTSARQLATAYHQAGQGADAGRANAGRGPPRMSAGQQPGPVWRSNILDALETWQNKGTAEQLRSHLAKTKGAMDEAEWIGLDDFLKDNPSVTKQQVAEFVKANAVDVQEVENGIPEDVDARLTELFDKEQDGTMTDAEFAEQEYLQDVVKRSEPKFSQYQLPGGENYRELLLTLNDKQKNVEAASKRLEELRKSGSDEEYQKAKEEWIRAMESHAPFKSSHFDEPNILAHVRFNERTDADGKRVLFLEEVQSDWHQKGRRQGYAEGEPKSTPRVEPDELRITQDEYQWRGHAPDGRQLSVGKGVVSTEAEARDYISRYMNKNAATDNMERLQAHRVKVPNAPFKQTWPMLAMKRMIRYAAENGFDRIAWTTGEQQAARYDLSKHLDAIGYQRRGELFNVAAFDKNGGTVWRSDHATIQDVEDHVGKEIAQKMVDGVGRADDQGSGLKYLEDINLKVGGEGMKGFYDRMLPSAVNQFVKKWGGRVGISSIKATDERVIQVNNGRWKIEGDPIGKDFATRSEALAATMPPIHSLDITPAMRDAALEGLPMFAAGEPGSENSPSDWQTIHRQHEQAGQELQAAIRQHMTPPAGMTKGQARNIRNQATAKLRNLRHDLLRHPGYAEHMIGRERQVWQQLKALLAPTGIKPSPDGLLGREDRIREVLSDVEVRRVVELDREWEQTRQEIEAMPKKLVSAISARLYPAAGTTRTDLELPSEWLQAQLGDRSPVTEPNDITTTADRLRDAVAALPDGLRDTWKASRKGVQAAWAKAQTRANRDTVSATKDAADNKAQILSRQAANVVLHELNRAFGVPIDTRNAAREAALTFAIEAGDKGTLDLLRETVLGSDHARSKWGRAAVQAIAYAEKHWDRLEPVVTLYNRVTNAQVAAEQASGIKTLMRAGGYVFHLQDVLENWAHLDMTGGAGGTKSPFKNIRDYATYADSIANGLNPKTLNAVDLLQRRISLGQKLINYRGWQESLKRIIDPATEQPLGADVVVRVRADGIETETAPVGYKIVRFAGQPYAIHRAYFGLFNALTADSGWRQGAGWHTLMKAATTAKHTMLMFDTFHLGRLAFWSAVTRGAGPGVKTLLPGNPASYRQGLTLLDSTIADLRKMAEHGELTAEQANNLIESKATLTRLLNAGLNVGSVGDNIYADWIQKLPLVGQFNRWLFEKYQRGAMTEVALIEYQRQRQANPELSEEQVARKVAKAVNIRFGNLNSQAWIKSRHAQDLARLVFLAPQWNESLVRAEVEAVKDAGVLLKNLPQGRLKVGTLGRAVATAFIGQFIANQLINWFFRDQPTWDNEEEGFEAKISAYVPDFVGNSKGFFLNPMTLPAEISHLILKGHARTGRWDQALIDAIKSRFSSFGRFADVFIEGKNSVGERASGLGHRLALAAVDSAPLPIGANAPARIIASKVTGESKEQYPGQFQRQIMQTFGIKPDSVPSPEQRMRRLAREFNTAQGKPDLGDFGKSAYADLDNALRVGNLTKARQELEALLQNHDAEAIQRRYEQRVTGRFTGSAEREPKFARTLNPEQRKQYDAALAERRRLKRAVEKLLNEASAKARKPQR